MTERFWSSAMRLPDDARGLDNRSRECGARPLVPLTGGLSRNKWECDRYQANALSMRNVGNLTRPFAANSFQPSCAPFPGSAAVPGPTKL
jgi:hypothetical protein